MRSIQMSLAGLFFGFALLPGMQAQQNDLSLIGPNELTYHSAFEKEAFSTFLNGDQKDPFELFLSFDATVDNPQSEQYRHTLDAFIREYPASSLSKMKDGKKVARLYADIHDQFLDKYVTFVPFSSIFNTREYHCVTSSMLFALVFDKLDIPYEIRVMPNHVYLLAYPRTSYITVETTDPTIGTVVYNAGFKSNFINYLREAKLISNKELSTLSTDQLFDKYYNTTQTISMQQLAGMQYRNEAILAFQDMDFNKAAVSMEKSYLLNPDTIGSYLLLLAWTLDYSMVNKTDSLCAVKLGKLSRFLNHGITSDMIVNEFKLIMQEQLFSEGDIEGCARSYSKITSFVKDSSLYSDLSFYYWASLGDQLCMKYEFAEAMPFLVKAAKIKPHNNDVLNSLFQAMITLVESQDPVTAVATVDSLMAGIPSLNDDLRFYQFRLSMYLRMVDFSFSAKDATTGEKYLTAFEARCPEWNPRYTYLSQDIERAFGTASMYYFRLGKNKRSLEIVDKGLEYLPNSYDLQNRKRALK